MYFITKREIYRSAIFIETSGWVHGTDVDPLPFYIELVLTLP
jgi:hypothetical protein